MVDISSTLPIQIIITALAKSQKRVKHGSNGALKGMYENYSYFFFKFVYMDMCR